MARHSRQQLRLLLRPAAVPSEIPLALTTELHDDREKNFQWNAFLNKSGLSADARSLREIAAILDDFLTPVSRAVADQSVFDQDWKPTGPWKQDPFLGSTDIMMAKPTILALITAREKYMISTTLSGVWLWREKGFTMSDSGMGVSYNQLLRRAVAPLTIIRKESSDRSFPFVLETGES